MKAKLKVKKYTDDPSLSWEERYHRLEEHHLAETKELIEMVERLENGLDSQRLREIYLAQTWPFDGDGG